MDTRQSRRNKSAGYRTEVAALKALKVLFPGLKRTGSMAYFKAAADLVQEGTVGGPLPLVVTRDKSKDLLVTLSVTALIGLVTRPVWDEIPVVVQVKTRQTTWIGTLYRELKEATK